MDEIAGPQIDKIASYYLSQYNYQQVIALYNEAILLYPNNGHFNIKLARTYAQAGNTQTAQSVIDALKAKSPEFYAQQLPDIRKFLKN